jgi:hypothetical protein
MRYTDEQIAHVVHEANRALQVIQGDPAPSLPWLCETPEIRANAIAGVRAARDGVSPRVLHETWCRDKTEHGWTYGPVKDAVARTHPCLVPYDQLPDGQREKNRVFIAVVEAMTLGLMTAWPKAVRD